MSEKPVGVAEYLFGSVLRENAEVAADLLDILVRRQHETDKGGSPEAEKMAPATPWPEDDTTAPEHHEDHTNGQPQEGGRDAGSGWPLFNQDQDTPSTPSSAEATSSLGDTAQPYIENAGAPEASVTDAGGQTTPIMKIDIGSLVNGAMRIMADQAQVSLDSDPSPQTNSGLTARDERVNSGVNPQQTHTESKLATVLSILKNRKKTTVALVAGAVGIVSFGLWSVLAENDTSSDAKKVLLGQSQITSLVAIINKEGLLPKEDKDNLPFAAMSVTAGGTYSIPFTCKEDACVDEDGKPSSKGQINKDSSGEPLVVEANLTGDNAVPFYLRATPKTDSSTTQPNTKVASVSVEAGIPVIVIEGTFEATPIYGTNTANNSNQLGMTISAFSGPVLQGSDAYAESEEERVNDLAQSVEGLAAQIKPQIISTSLAAVLDGKCSGGKLDEAVIKHIERLVDERATEAGMSIPATQIKVMSKMTGDIRAIAAKVTGTEIIVQNPQVELKGDNVECSFQSLS